MDSISNFLAHFLEAGGTGSGGFTFVQALGALGVAYAGGVLASLTPCVYPMIPITVSVVGGVGPARRSWREVVVRGIAYVGGMTVVYSFLGVLAGLTGRVFGTLTNTPGWYLGLGAVMTIAGLIMMDVVPFDPAVWWETLKHRFILRGPGGGKVHHHHAQTREATIAAAFTLGASSGFIAAPCTTPVLTAILAYIAKTQSVILGLSLMFAFSLGLGTILMLIAAFAGALQILPRSGGWMKTVKLASGLLLLAFAEYLIYRAGTMAGA
jgi:thiol:disulfide interchange protein DsbD